VVISNSRRSVCHFFLSFISTNLKDKSDLIRSGGPLKIKTTFNYIDKAGAVAVLVKGSWDNYKDDVPLVEISGKFSGCVALLPGVYQYHYKLVLLLVIALRSTLNRSFFNSGSLRKMTSVMR